MKRSPVYGPGTPTGEFRAAVFGEDYPWSAHGPRRAMVDVVALTLFGFVGKRVCV